MKKIIFLILLISIPFVLAETQIDHEIPLSLSDDEGYIYAGYDSGKIRVFDAETLELNRTIETGQKYIWTIVSDAENIYFGTSDKKTNSMTKEGVLLASSNHSDFVLDLFIEKDRIYACDRAGILNIFSIPKLTELGSIDVLDRCSSVFVDNNYIYAIYNKTSIGIWDKKTFENVAVSKINNYIIYDLLFSGNYIYSVAYNDTLKIFNKSLSFINETNEAVPLSWDLEEDEKNIYATSGSSVVVIDKQTNSVLTGISNRFRVGSSTSEILSLGDFIYSASDDGRVVKWSKGNFSKIASTQLFTYEEKVFEPYKNTKWFFFGLLAFSTIGFIVSTFIQRRKKKPQPQPSQPVQEQKPAETTKTEEKKDEKPAENQ